MSKQNKSTYVKVADRVKQIINPPISEPNVDPVEQHNDPVQLVDGISYRLVPAPGKLVVVETLTIKDGIIVSIERGEPNVPYMAYATLIKQIGLSLSEIFNG